MSGHSTFRQRWAQSIVWHGAELEKFWVAHLAEKKRRVLFILAHGFDPRMCLGLEMMLRLRGTDPVDVALIEYYEGPNSPSLVYQTQIQANHDRLQKIMSGRGMIRRFILEMRASDGRRVASQNALRLFSSMSDLGDYSDVVLDISAAPRGVYLPLAAKILHLVEAKPETPSAERVNFHIIVAEDSFFDGKIFDEGVEERADFVAPFKGGFNLVATAVQPKVWIPLLGESQKAQLERIHELVQPDEICPVLPSPARNPRRGDNLVEAYHELLFDKWAIEPGNLIYGSERNPVEVYRQLFRAICSYRESFAPLGGAKFAISAVSSKLLSVAALLVAYDFRKLSIEIGIAHVDCHGYRLDEHAQLNSELSGLWLTGEWEVPVTAAPAGNLSAPQASTEDGKTAKIGSTAPAPRTHKEGAPP